MKGQWELCLQHVCCSAADTQLCSSNTQGPNQILLFEIHQELDYFPFKWSFIILMESIHLVPHFCSPRQCMNVTEGHKVILWVKFEEFFCVKRPLNTSVVFWKYDLLHIFCVVTCNCCRSFLFFLKANYKSIFFYDWIHNFWEVLEQKVWWSALVVQLVPVKSSSENVAFVCCLQFILAFHFFLRWWIFRSPLLFGYTNQNTDGETCRWEKFSLGAAARSRSVRCDLGHNCIQLSLCIYSDISCVWEGLKL